MTGNERHCYCLGSNPSAGFLAGGSNAGIEPIEAEDVKSAELPRAGCRGIVQR